MESSHPPFPIDQQSLVALNCLSSVDPGESNNLAGLGGFEADWLRVRLAAWVERGKLEEVGDDGEEQVDEETRERLRALGYVD